MKHQMKYTFFKSLAFLKSKRLKSYFVIMEGTFFSFSGGVWKTNIKAFSVHYSKCLRFWSTWYFAYRSQCHHMQCHFMKQNLPSPLDSIMCQKFSFWIYIHSIIAFMKLSWIPNSRRCIYKTTQKRFHLCHYLIR